MVLVISYKYKGMRKMKISWSSGSRAVSIGNKRRKIEHHSTEICLSCARLTIFYYNSRFSENFYSDLTELFVNIFDVFLTWFFGFIIALCFSVFTIRFFLFINLWYPGKIFSYKLQKLIYLLKGWFRSLINIKIKTYVQEYEDTLKTKD